VPGVHDELVLKAGVDGVEPVTPALTKQRTFRGYAGLSTEEYRLTSLVFALIIRTLVGLTIGARNIYYLTSGRYEPYRFVPSHTNENKSRRFAVEVRVGATPAGHLNIEFHVNDLPPEPSCTT
jgi:hypothetical protein